MRCIRLLNLHRARCTLATSIIILISFMMVDASPMNTAHLLSEYQSKHHIKIQALKKQVQRQIKQFEQQLINTTMIEPPSDVSITPYPIVSTELTSGKVTHRKVTLKITHPLFLVGFDRSSIQWLKHYGHRLQQLEATGFVVNVKTMQQLHTLRKIVPQLRLIPLPANVLAEQLKIHHYPVLISTHLIEQ